MAKSKVVFFCKDCGYESPAWLGKCPGCGNWNSFVEEKISTTKNNSKRIDMPNQEVKKLSEIDIKQKERLDTGFEELNRVLGGGIVDGSLILFGGEPGIGKSTLILQVCEKLSKYGDVLYVSGEESDIQVKLRADRLDVKSDKVLFLGETNILNIENKIENIKPKVCVIDSIQTMYDEEISSVPGSVSQVREITARLMNISKKLGIITIVIGHVTKDGQIAGPRMLEHMVDVVLYIEGERFLSHRIIRGVKNRFGSTNEIGIFEMQQKGLMEVKNMSEMFLTKSSLEPGNVIMPLLEGTSTLMIELQALTTHSYYNMPRRVSSGIDFNRLNMIIAILEKKCNMNLGTQDIYVNVVGGIKVTETASDLAVAMSMVSSFKDICVPADSIFVGELSLTGEIRSVVNIEKRVKEAAKLGFKKFYGPKGQLDKLKQEGKIKDMMLISVKNINDLILAALNSK